MLEKPSSVAEELWDAEHCRLSFAVPKEPRGRGCTVPLPVTLVVTVGGCVGGYWQGPFVTESLEDVGK